MAGIIGTTSPCVQVVDTYVHYFYNLPPLEGMPTPSPGADVPLVSRNMYVFKVLITCPGIWTIQAASFTYTNLYGETMPMTMVDFSNSFPVVLPENETVEVELAWDYQFDGILGYDSNPGSYTTIVQSALNYCVSLQTVPYLPPPPPPPPPPGGGIADPYEGTVTYPLPEDYIPSNNDAGSSTDLPSEADATGSNSGEPHIPGSDGDVADGAENPDPYDADGSGDPMTSVPNMALADMYRLKKFDVNGRILSDFNDRQTKPGNRPAINKPDKPTTTMPIAGIGEPQEIHFTQLNNKSALSQNSFSPGQSFVPRVKNANAVDNLIYQPNRNQIVGKKTVVKGTTVSDKSVGSKINIRSTISNPNIDINTKELHGSLSDVDNYNSYVTKDPKAGSRLESVPIYNSRDENKLDSNGRPIKSSQTRKDGAASTSPKSPFNLFTTNIPKEKIQAFISRHSTRQLAQTSGNQDYEIPLSLGDFTIVDDSNIIYNGGQGLFYGVGPFDTIESDAFLGGLFNLSPRKDGIVTFVTVNDSSIVESNVVTPASIGIQNNSFHQTEYNVLIVIGILDSEAVFRYIGYNYINIPPRSYQFMNAIIPPGLPPGAAKVVGMAFDSNNDLMLSEKEDIIIAPDGYTIEGYTPHSPNLPASLANLANDPSPLHGGRVFEVIGKRRYRAVSNSIDIIAKAPQIAVTRGLDSKITAIDISSTGSSSDRYTIDGVEIFAGAHDAYLQFDTTSGNNVDIKITDKDDKTHSTYGFNVFGSNLEIPTFIFSGIANSQGYLGGNIQTNVINGRILLENQRTAISTTIPTTHEGHLILNTLSGWNQTGEEITQVVLGQTPYLGFDSLPGDTISIYAEGIGGNYNDLIIQETLLPDSSVLLPTGVYILPDEANIPVPIPDPNTNGDTIPPNSTPDPDPPPLPNTDPDDDDPPPPPPPGDPLPTNGECVVPSGSGAAWKIQIISACQRPSNPCIVDIVAELYMCDPDGNPIASSTHQAEIMYELCSFSLDSTNGIDGIWYQLNPLASDSQHSGGNPIALPGTYNFVADMCDHFSTFFSTNSIMFKLIFRIGEQDTMGEFVGNCSTGEILG